MENGFLRELQKIPGKGPGIARDQYELGYRSIKELAKEDPQTMYGRLCVQKSVRMDRCILCFVAPSVSRPRPTRARPVARPA